MAQIKFNKGLVSNLPTQSVEGHVYFTTDENIYLGLAGGAYKRYGDFNKVANVAALPVAGANEQALYYCVDENVLAIYNKTTSKWVKVNPDHNTTYTLEAGAANGTVKLVGSDGTNLEVSVKGLGTAAYTDSTAYAAADHDHVIDDVTGLADAIADAKKAGTDAQTEVDTLETKVGTIPEGKTVVTMIEDAKTAATYDDTDIQKKASDNATAIEGLKTKVGEIPEGATATTVIGYVDEKAAAAVYDDTALKGRVSTLEGSDAGKSARAIAAEETAKIVANADASFDTLKEIADWISTHKTDASAMNSSILALEAIVDGIGGEGEKATVITYVTDAIAALKIGDYAKAAELTDAVKRIVSLETTANGLGALAEKDVVSETDLDTALKEKVNSAAEGNHSHGNKEVLDGITSDKVAAWDAAEVNVIDGITSSTLTVGAVANKKVSVDIEWGTF